MKQTMEKKNMTRRAAVLLFGAVLSCLAACTHPSGLERTMGTGLERIELNLRRYSATMVMTVASTGLPCFC